MNKPINNYQKKQSSKSERKAYLVCNVTVDETDGIRWKRVWFCKRCHDSKNFNLDGNCIRLSNNEILIQVSIQAVYALFLLQFWKD